MWLLPVLDLVSRAAAQAYYRLTVSGEPVPSDGPALLVANHPNSLLDPVLVVAAAGRPVRFLAKSTLFPDPRVGWLVKAAGSIPVYRREDDPSRMQENRSMFRAVHEAFVEGAAVGIFPEGISHSDPSLADIRTGAARIALGGAEHLGRVLPVIPVGIVPERKEFFRSRMLVIVGEPLEWEELAGRGEDDREAVRELTGRIEEALRRVTLNLERWEDRPLVDAAERIWSLHHEHDGSAAARVRRLEVATRILARVRSSEEEEGRRLYLDLSGHLGRLKRLGLSPEDLERDPDRSRSLGALARAYAVGVASAVPYVLAVLLYFAPYQLTARLVARSGQPEDRVSTYKLLIGIPVYGVWIMGLGALAWLALGWVGAALALILLPTLGVWGNRVRERWREAGQEMLLLRRLGHLRRWLGTLRSDQRDLAGRLDGLFEVSSGESPPS